MVGLDASGAIAFLGGIVAAQARDWLRAHPKYPPPADERACWLDGELLQAHATCRTRRDIADAHARTAGRDGGGLEELASLAETHGVHASELRILVLDPRGRGAASGRKAR